MNRNPIEVSKRSASLPVAVRIDTFRQIRGFSGWQLPLSSESDHKVAFRAGCRSRNSAVEFRRPDQAKHHFGRLNLQLLERCGIAPQSGLIFSQLSTIDSQLNMSDLPKQYQAQDAQAKWLDFWKNNGYFDADPNADKKPHTIMIPLPNVTGALHMGHALNGTLQDLITRWRRMQGYEALWMPGTDHAGIATQAAVSYTHLTLPTK